MINDPSILAERANALRRRDLVMLNRAGLGHTGGDFSAADILTTLYLSVLRVDPARPDWPERDRFILSKGHASGMLYNILAEVGFISPDELATFVQPESRLNGHPSNSKLPGVETSTGPLGHGMPVAVGAALGAQMDDASWRTFVLTGDGELQEGSNWEAAMAAAHFRLDNLTLIVDRNGIQQGDLTERTMRLEPLADKFRAFGWAVREVDGHDHAALLAAFGSLPFEPGKPSCIIARTHKGKGVSFIQDRAEWHHHHRRLSDEEMAEALAELGDGGQGAGAGDQPGSWKLEAGVTICRNGLGRGQPAISIATANRCVGRLPRCVRCHARSPGPRRPPRRRGVQRLGQLQQARPLRKGIPRPAGQRGHRRAGHDRDRRGAGQRGQAALRLRRVVLPHRPGVGADQGRSGLLARQRQALRHEQWRRLR
jgi:transketolase